ncbi:MAG: hypothetical protein IT371_16000 [Deltaproteobacteria bacterium]|nr:hypothetical protein [Deltaproteobacteria bacterium]
MDLKVFFDDEALDPAARQRLADSEYIGTLYLRVFNRWPPYSLALATSLAEFYPTIGPLSLRGGQTLTFPRRLNVGTHWIAAVWWPQSRPKGFVPLRSGDLINTGTCEPPPYLVGGPAEEALHDEYYRCALPYGKRGVPRVVVKESDVGTTLKNVVVRINAEYDPRFEEATPTPSSSSDQ